MNNKGFSLIEITMVLLIMGIAAAAVTLRIEPLLHHVTMDQVAADIVDFDRLTRAMARRHDRRLRLVLDTSAGELRRLDAAGADSCGRALTLPDNYAIMKVLVRSQDVGAGTISLSCSRRGFMPTYAVCLADPGGRRQWILLTALGGQEVNLTATEYRVLSYMARSADRVVTTDQILGEVWGREYFGETHLLQVTVARLRQKLGDDARYPRYIVTKPGIGYAMAKKKAGSDSTPPTTQKALNGVLSWH